MTTSAYGEIACISGVSRDCGHGIFRLEGGATRSQTRRDTNFAIPGCLRAALLRRPFIVPYFPPGRKMEPKLFSIHAPGPAPQAVSPASRRQTLTPAMARAKTNQKMLITRG